MIDDPYEKAKELRLTYRSCLKIADETDSKKEDAYLRAEAKSTLEELKKICPHKDVAIVGIEYRWYSDDDRGTPERRKCLCCDTNEEKYVEGHKEKFLILKDENTKWRIDSKPHDELTNPLKYLLSECQEVAAECWKPLIRFIK